MRIFNNCTDMLDETYREIWKRGQTIFDKTVQGKIVGEKDYEQREVVFYTYRVDNFDDLPQMLEKAKKTFGKEHVTLEVAKAWTNDMLENLSLHETWWDLNESTKDYFSKFCDEGNGLASYSYGERMMLQVPSVVARLKSNPFSRGAIITLLNGDDVGKIGRRIPCTISYHFLARPTIGGVKLNLIVNQRSADAINFFPLDFAKAVMLLQHVSNETGLAVGSLIHSINSLHVYALDVPEEYKW